MNKINKPWFVYITECGDKSYYTGITTNVEKRIHTHNSKKGAKYTTAHLPIKLVYFEKHQDRSMASKREHVVKKLTRAQKILLINAVSNTK